MSDGDHEATGAHTAVPVGEWRGDPEGLQFQRRLGEGPDGADVIQMRSGLDPDTVLEITPRMYDDMIAGVLRGDFDEPDPGLSGEPCG